MRLPFFITFPLEPFFPFLNNAMSNYKQKKMLDQISNPMLTYLIFGVFVHASQILSYAIFST